MKQDFHSGLRNLLVKETEPAAFLPWATKLVCIHNEVSDCDRWETPNGAAYFDPLHVYRVFEQANVELACFPCVSSGLSDFPPAGWKTYLPCLRSVENRERIQDSTQTKWEESAKNMYVCTVYMQSFESFSPFPHFKHSGKKSVSLSHEIYQNQPWYLIIGG